MRTETRLRPTRTQRGSREWTTQPKVAAASALLEAETSQLKAETRHLEAEAKKLEAEARRIDADARKIELEVEQLPLQAEKFKLEIEHLEVGLGFRVLLLGSLIAILLVGMTEPNISKEGGEALLRLLSVAPK